MVFIINSVITFLVSILVSGVVIYLVTKMLGEREGYGTALLTAFIGALIFSIAYFFIPGLWASVIGGIAWLFALTALYNIGWLRSFIIAIVVWAFAALISYVLPTAAGPL